MYWVIKHKKGELMESNAEERNSWEKYFHDLHYMEAEGSYLERGGMWSKKRRRDIEISEETKS